MGHNIVGNIGVVTADSQNVHVGPQTITPPEVIHAFRDLAQAVNRQGEAATLRAFQDFAIEFQKPRPERSALRSLWDGLVKILPEVTKVGTSVQALASFIG